MRESFAWHEDLDQHPGRKYYRTDGLRALLLMPKNTILVFILHPLKASNRFRVYARNGRAYTDLAPALYVSIAGRRVLKKTLNFGINVSQMSFGNLEDLKSFVGYFKYFIAKAGDNSLLSPEELSKLTELLASIKLEVFIPTKNLAYLEP